MQSHSNQKKIKKNQRRKLILSLEKQTWDVLEKRLQPHPELFRPYAKLRDGGEVYYLPEGRPSSVMTKLFEEDIDYSAVKEESVQIKWMVHAQLCMYQTLLKLLCHQFGEQGRDYFDLLFGTEEKSRLMITCYPPHFNTEHNCDLFPGELIDKVHPLYPLISEMKSATEEMRTSDEIAMFLDMNKVNNLLSKPVKTIRDSQTKLIFENELVEKIKHNEGEILFSPIIMRKKAKEYFSLGLASWQDNKLETAHNFFLIALKEARQAELINFDDKDTLLSELENDEKKVQAKYAKDNDLVVKLSIATAVSAYSIGEETSAHYLMEEVWERTDWNRDRMQKTLIPYFEETLHKQESNNLILACDFLAIITFLNFDVLASKNKQGNEAFYIESMLLNLRMGSIQSQEQKQAAKPYFDKTLAMLHSDFSQFMALLDEHYFTIGKKMFIAGRVTEAKEMFLVCYHAYTYLLQSTWTISSLDKVTKLERIKIMQRLAIATFNLGSVKLQTENNNEQGLLLVRFALSQASVCFGRGHTVTNSIRRFYHMLFKPNNLLSSADMSLFTKPLKQIDNASSHFSSNSPSSTLK